MSGISYNVAIVEYTPLNTDWVFLKGDGREYQKRRRACNKAYEKFRNLRGSILGKAVAVERRLDSVISGYFCPHYRSRRDRLRTAATKLQTKMNNELWKEIECLCVGFAEDISKESQVLRERLNDIVLGNEGCSFRAKADILRSIMDAVKTTQPSKTKVDKALTAVMTRRNHFAHRKVGIDWDSPTCSLRNARAGKWEPVPDTEEATYKEACREALDLVDAVASSIWSTRQWVCDDDDR